MPVFQFNITFTKFQGIIQKITFSVKQDTKDRQEMSKTQFKAILITLMKMFLFKF